MAIALCEHEQANRKSAVDLQRIWRVLPFGDGLLCIAVRPGGENSSIR